MNHSEFAVLGSIDRLDATIQWYHRVSSGHARLAPTRLRIEPPPDGWERYAIGGGTGPWPHNSQEMANALLDRTDHEAVSAAGACVVLAVPDSAGFVPHTWRFRSGGYWLGGRVWVRRYSVIPESAPLGTVAHELGHLLFGWPDLRTRSGFDGDCLMAAGGHDGNGARPTPPCAPLRVAAGWAHPISARREMTVAESEDQVIRVGSSLVEGTPHGTVIIYADSTDPRLIARVRADPDRRLLAVVAPRLRRTRKPIRRFTSDV